MSGSWISGLFISQPWGLEATLDPETSGQSGQESLQAFPHRAKRAAGFGRRQGWEDRLRESVPRRMRAAAASGGLEWLRRLATRKLTISQAAHTVPDWLYFQIRAISQRKWKT